MVGSALALTLGAAGAAAAASPEDAFKEQDLATPKANAPEPAAITAGPRLAGGRPATPGEHPYVVHLGINTPRGNFRCTGSVISPEWILTAAHCVTQGDGTFFPDPVSVTVTAGATDITGAPPQNQFPATNLFVPAGWLGADNSFANDYALLRLANPVSVRGLPLPPAPHGGEAPGVAGTLAGYGNVSEGPPGPDVPTNVLHVGTAPILSDADCGFYFGTSYVPGIMNCTGPPPGQSPVDATTCKGDSGGPLFVPFGSDYLQAGITSFGPTPCQISRTGAYTKVSAFSGVIADNLINQDSTLGPPVATTGAATAQFSDGLEVQGTVDPNGIASAFEVEWGTTRALGERAARGFAGDSRSVTGRAYAGQGATPTTVTARITGAPPSTQIFYRFSAVNAAGIARGTTASAQTAAAPSPPPPPPPPPAAQQVTQVAEPTARCMGMTATIVGTPGRDVLNGTPGRDVIVALEGNDVIRGRGGNDIVCAGSGRDTVLGGPGRDKLLGQGGNDKLRGRGGNDTMRGGSGRDNIQGGAGRDRGFGDGGRDVLAGGAKADRLHGGGGRDVLRGNAGPDLLVGNGGRDIGIGGPGRDRYRGIEIRRA